MCDTTLAAENAALRRYVDALDRAVRLMEQRPGDEVIFRVLTSLIGALLGAVDARDGALLVVDEDSKELVFVHASGEVGEEMLTWRRLPPGEGIAGWVVDNHRIVNLCDARTDTRFYSNFDEEFDFQTTSLLAVPVIRNNVVLGVLEILNKGLSGHTFSVEDESLAKATGSVAGVMLYMLLKGAEDRENASEHERERALGRLRR